MTHQFKTTTALTSIRLNKKKHKSILSLLPMGMLAACGGSGGDDRPDPDTPDVPDFTESPTGTFTARDSSDGLTLSRATSTSNLTVFGLGGDDIINTGSGDDVIEGGGGEDTITSRAGNDVIDGGAGEDTINAGEGNDIIMGGLGVDDITAGAGDDIVVLIGTSAASQYTADAITNSAGQGLDLSALLELSDINDVTTTHAASGETINGGEGNNTLVVYGDVDLSTLNLTNFDTIWMNSTVTMTKEQFAFFSNLVGDGTSKIVLSGDDGRIVVDLANKTITGVGEIETEDNLTVILSDIDDLDGIDDMVSGDYFTLQIEASAGTVLFTDILEEVDGLTSIYLKEAATLDLTGATAAQLQTLTSIDGDGIILVTEAQLADTALFTGVAVDSTIIIRATTGAEVSAEILGGTTSTMLDASDTPPTITLEAERFVTEGEAEVAVTIILSDRYYEDITLTVELPDGETEEVTIFAGETSKTVTFELEADDDEVQGNQDLTISVTESNVVTELPVSTTVTVLDNDASGDGTADIPDTPDTNIDYVVGTTFTSVLNPTSDIDYLNVELEAGVIYRFTLSDATDLFDIELSSENGSGDYRTIDNDESDDLHYIDVYVTESGTYQLKIEADDDETVGTYTLTSEIVDRTEPSGIEDYSDTVEGAFAIDVATTYRGAISDAFDVDYFSITLTAGEIISINVTLSSAADDDFDFINILDENGNEIDYEIAETETGRSLVFKAPISGTFTFAIADENSEPGSTYSLQADYVDTLEPDASADYGDSIETAVTLAIDTPINATLYQALDSDWFAISVTAGQTYEIITALTDPATSPYDTAPDFKVVDASGNEVDDSLYEEGITDDGRVYITFNPQATGDYYIVVDDDDNVANWDYTLSYSQILNAEPNGARDYTYDNPGILTLGGSIDGRLSSLDDVDYIAFEVVAGETYVVSLTTADGTTIGISEDLLKNDYDWTFNTVNNNLVFTNGLATNYTFTADFTGTFYLPIESNIDTGLYSISLTEGNLNDDIDAGLTTTSVLSVGGTATGSIDIGGDRDWFQVTLEAGMVYQITMTGSSSGNGTLGDTRIEYIYDSQGNAIPLTYNDDGNHDQGDYESAMLFQPTVSGVYYIAAGGWSNSTGTYQLAIQDVSADFAGVDLPISSTNRETIPIINYDIDLTGDSRIDGLLSGMRWSADPDGDTTTITWSFMSDGNFSTRSGFGYDNAGSGTDNGDEPYLGFSELTDAQKAVFSSLLAYVESIINIDMVQVADVSGPTGSPGSAGNIRIGWTGLLDQNASAWAYYPSGGPIGGDIWLLSENLSSDETRPFFFYVLIHELGHALGLSHSFNDETGVSTVPIDSMEYTVMSYTDTADFADAVFSDLYPQTWMYYDILALEHMYGLRDYNSGDTTYTFDGAQQYYMTLWDTDGTDTIEFINMQEGVNVNLQGGYWSDVNTTVTYYNIAGVAVGTRESTVFIPEEIDIENASGTDFADTITGGEEDNKLRGLGGDDIIDGGSGDDYIAGGGGMDGLTGGDGDDVFVFVSGEAVSDVASADVITDFMDGEDKIGLVGMTFSDLTIEDSGADTVIKDANGNIIVVLTNVDHTLIETTDFVTLASDWYQ